MRKTILGELIPVLNNIRNSSYFLPAVLILTSFITACDSDNDLGSMGQDTDQSMQSTTGMGIPRFDDGLVRLDRSPGEFSGYWGNPTADSLIEIGVDVAMDERGLLANIDDASKVAPFMPWSLALYKYRQENNLKDDPVRGCISPAGPRHIHDDDGFRIIQDRNYNRIYLLFAGGNMNWRVIFMDGRTPPNPEEVTGTYYGHSTGHWEGDTLIVASSGFIDRFWFSNGGLPHSRALRLIERFTRLDYETLKYEVTIDDPHTYTRPWTSEWTLSWQHGLEIEQDFCEDNKHD